MHLHFIAHTHACQMYVAITCKRLKREFRFISCRIVLISVQDDGDNCKSISKDELSQPRGSLANDITSCAMPIKSFNKMLAIHNMRQMHSNFRIFKFHVLFNFIY